MPNSKQAKKRLRQSFVRRDRNRAKKTRLRHSIRKVREAVAAGNLQQAQELAQLTQKLLDRSASQRVIHRNKAARLKARIAHLIVSHKQSGQQASVAG
ncbi:MAG: 30S ribosomal protein S20 [Pirellulaceae bacterium]|nr:MAG: 30S ribosomal protein S20 [Pirellulaceae bacterium]